MSYVKNIETDEIRDGFLVTSDMKRVWNKEIELILELSRVCKKYNLRWFAAYGTLLGAARHRGFIPWDDDVDVVMPREDYDKLKQIAAKEFHYPYYFDLWYDNDDPRIYDFGWPVVAFSKLRDSRTTFIEFPERTRVPAGTWIDIFPLNSAPPFDNHPRAAELYREFKLLQDLFFVACMPQRAQQFLNPQSGYKFLLHPKQVEEFLQLPLRERGKIYEERLIELDRTTKMVSYSAMLPIDDRISQNSTPREYWEEDGIELPFEQITLPAPKEFDDVLTRYYGDWHKMVSTHMHAKATSMDIPYKTYFAMQDNPGSTSIITTSLAQNLGVDEMRDGSLVTSRKKKIWRKKLDLILELARVCEKLDLKFWASGGTLYSARKLHGFDPLNDFVTLEMTRDDFEKLEFKTPLKLIKNSGGGRTFRYHHNTYSIPRRKRSSARNFYRDSNDRKISRRNRVLTLRIHFDPCPEKSHVRSCREKV